MEKVAFVWFLRLNRPSQEDEVEERELRSQKVRNSLARAVWPFELPASFRQLIEDG